MQNALANSAQIRVAEAQVELSEGEANIARSRFFPEISLTARATRINDPLTIDLDEIRTAMIGLHSPPYGTLPAAALEQQLPHFKKAVQKEQFYNAAVNVQFPIFTGGRIWAGYKAGRENVDSYKENLNLVKNSIALETCERYFGLSLANEVVLLQENTQAILSEHVEKAKKLYDNGQIALAERLRAEVALAEAERDLEDAKRDRSLARLALVNTIGGDTSVVPVTELKDVKIPSDMETLRKKAEENHPGLKRLEIENKRARRGVSAARGEWFPVLAIFGKRELYTKDLTLLEPDWAVGINMQWDIFQGGSSAGKIAAAKSLQRTVSAQREKASSDIRLLLEKRFREFEHAKGRLQSLGKTDELAKESLRAQQSAFDSGLATSLDVVDAQLALTRLGIAKLKAKYDANIALAGILEATGEIQNVVEILGEDN